MNRPPTPVLAAVGIYALLALMFLISAVAIAIAGAPALALLAIGALLVPGSVALGLWQRNRGARVAAFVLALPSIVGPVVLVFLLVAPESSRAWFNPELDEDEFGDEHPGDEVTSDPAKPR